VIYFAWDEAKAASNFRKHGVDFNDAASVFDDPCATTFKERVVDGEQRWQTFGLFDGVQVLLVAHTIELDHEDEYIRIISARRANKAERRQYEIQNEQ